MHVHVMFINYLLLAMCATSLLSFLKTLVTFMTSLRSPTGGPPSAILAVMEVLLVEVVSVFFRIQFFLEGLVNLYCYPI